MLQCTLCQQTYPTAAQYRFCPACAGTLVSATDPDDEPVAGDPVVASEPDMADAIQESEPPPGMSLHVTGTPAASSPPPKLQVEGDLGFVRLNDWSRTVNVYLGLGEHATAEDLVRGLATDSGPSLDALQHLLQQDEVTRTTPRRLNLDEYVVPADDLDHVRAVFVPPPNFDEARAALSRPRLLVLAGPPHSGRLTAALALAADLATTVCLLPHDLVVSERQLFQARPATPVTFIVRDGESRTAGLAQSLIGSRYPPDLARVRATLLQHQSYLILVCDPSSALVTTAAMHQALVNEGVLVEPGHPPPAAVLERHLQHTLGRAVAARLRAALGGHFAEIAQRCRTAGRIAKFARLLARRLTQSPDDVMDDPWPAAEETLRLVADARAEARSLFQNLPDDRHRYAVLALTLFAGSRLPDYWTVLQRILDRSGLETPQAAGAAAGDELRPEPTPVASHFALSDAGLVEAIGGQIVDATVESDLGPVSVKIVRFVDADLHDALRQFLYDHYHAHLLGLLPLFEELVQRSGPDLRRAAARALGSIGTLDFERLLVPLVERWRRSDQAYLRAAVGQVLDQALGDPTCAPLTIQLLRGWGATRASGGERWKFQWTTAATWKTIGLGQPTLALAELKHLARHVHLAGDRDAATMVFPALAYTLIVLSVQGHLAAVLTTLDDWMGETEDAAHTLPLTATLLWIQLMGVFHDLTRAARRQDPAARPVHEVVRLLLQTPDETAHPAPTSRLTTGVAASLVSQGFVQMYGVQESGRRQHTVVLDVVRQWVEDSPATPEVLAVLQAVLEQASARLAAHKNRTIHQHFLVGLRRWRATRQSPAAARLAERVLLGG